jgi:bifunctional N-acetylglucosamine-1-phosphate-uridyltransferase/glucosamine-1-phosphate-acetyltransferase GlmU-like protein
VYLHPLAGRPILWHVLRALSEGSPPPSEIVVVHHPDLQIAESMAPGARLSALPVDDPAEGEARAMRAAVTTPGMTLLVDGAAALLTPATVARLLRAAEHGVAMVAGDDDAVPRIAVAGEGPALASAEDPRLPVSATRVTPTSTEELVRVTDRHSLAIAQACVRDRLVRLHEARGVSFLLPATVWLDVDVRIGTDTLVYPGVVIEGETEIGSECVIGPYSRLIEATIGRGVELRGWNYVSRAAVRNHAVLEPYVRRGID